MRLRAAVRLRRDRPTRSSGRRTGVRFVSRAARRMALRLRASVPMRRARRRRRGRVHAARRRVGVVHPRAGLARPGRRPAAAPDYVADAFKETVELLAPLGRALVLPGPVARDGEPVGGHTEAPHLARARLDRRLAHVRPARAGRRRNGTGTTATPGSATRRSRSTGSCGSATRRRRLHSCAGSRRAAKSSSRTARCRSCTASTGATSSSRRRCRISKATWARRPCASATPPTVTSSSTSMAS